MKARLRKRVSATGDTSRIVSAAMVLAGMALPRQADLARADGERTTDTPSELDDLRSGRRRFGWMRAGGRLRRLIGHLAGGVSHAVAWRGPSEGAPR